MTGQDALVWAPVPGRPETLRTVLPNGDIGFVGPSWVIGTETDEVDGPGTSRRYRWWTKVTDAMPELQDDSGYDLFETLAQAQDAITEPDFNPDRGIHPILRDRTLDQARADRGLPPAGDRMPGARTRRTRATPSAPRKPMPASLAAAGMRAVTVRENQALFGSDDDGFEQNYGFDDSPTVRVRHAAQTGGCAVVEGVFVWGAQRCGIETDWETQPDDEGRSYLICTDHIEESR